MSMRFRTRAALWLPLITAGFVCGDSRPADRHPDAALLPKATRQLYDETTLFPRRTKWLTIPWLRDLGEAVRAAKVERRPVLIWVSGDDPLERC